MANLETTYPQAPATCMRRPLWSWLRTPWDYFAMVAGLIYLGVCGILFTLVSAVAFPLLSQSAGTILGRWLAYKTFSGLVLHLKIFDLVRVEDSSLESVRKIRGAAIVAPNHSSLWDVVFIIAKMPGAICIMKSSILRNCLMGRVARLARYIPNENPRQLLRDATASLESAGQLLLFPEGTRTKPSAEWISPLKRGCAVIAKRSGVPVYPVMLRSDSRYLQKGWPLWLRPVFPIRLQYEVLAPVSVSAGESVEDFTARLEEIYRYELAKPHPLRRLGTEESW